MTYEHYLEEPGNLEIEYSSIFGTQRGGNNFHAHSMEFEYGVKAWWTTEFYLDCKILVNEGLGGSFFVGEHRGFVSAPLQCPHARSWFVSDQFFLRQLAVRWTAIHSPHSPLGFGPKSGESGVGRFGTVIVVRK